jgi:hypothetical protein
MIVKKSLFDEDERYTPIASDLDLEVHKALLPIFEKYFALGITIREIAYLMHNSVLDVELEKLFLIGDEHGNNIVIKGD